MITQLQEKILKLKKEKDFAILAHSYQSTEILEIADLTGDSFALSQKASSLPQKNLLMCGVRFMADTAKLMCPDKNVVLASRSAVCPMANQISPEKVLEYKKNNPECKVVAYINTTTALKAVSDVCVTSSSALKIVSSMKEKHILFIPDKNLGSYVKKMLPEKNIVLWDGCCPIHNAITKEDVLAARKEHPDAVVMMHPECPAEAVALADIVGSTALILEEAKKCSKPVIIATEKSIADYLSMLYPDREFYPLTKTFVCPDMRITTLSDVYKAIAGIGGLVIDIPEDVAKKAKRPIEEMIRLGK